MKKAQNSTTYKRVDTFRSRAEMLAAWSDVFKAVVVEYVRLKSLCPIVSMTWDPLVSDRSQRLSCESIDYICDIEHATESALKDRPELQKTWFQLALKQPADPTLCQQCIEATGRIYTARRLAPWQYWRRNRYPQRRAA